MNKPIEFWIWNNWGMGGEDPACMYIFGTTIDELKNVDDEQKIHVIEKSAYDELKSKADKLAEALEKVLSETEHPYLEQALKEYRGEK